MCCTPNDTFWGGWLLGDLANIAGRAANLAGFSYAVDRMTVEGPTGPDDLPVVTLEVASEELVYRIHHQLTNGEHHVQCHPGASETGWSAEVQGVILKVALTPDGAS